MWVYKFNTVDGYDVGYFIHDRTDQDAFYSVQTFNEEIHAARYVHYLNGGDGTAAKLLSKAVGGKE